MLFIVVVQFAGSSKIESEFLEIETVRYYIINTDNIPWVDHRGLWKLISTHISIIPINDGRLSIVPRSEHENVLDGCPNIVSD
jgi:hypothetical protein